MNTKYEKRCVTYGGILSHAAPVLRYSVIVLYKLDVVYKTHWNPFVKRA